ncbi:MAG: BREX protein BrxB domain-containing protein, partial [Nostoc sp.]
DSIVELEREQGFEAAQEQVNIYLSDQDWCPLPDLLAQRLKALDPQRHIVFLLRSASMAPAIYQMSKLLDEMQGKTRIATILFYPGTLEGTTGLRMMALKNREAMGNYRVKIYG